ncbi:MAG: redoxin domain-containing protein [Planctomycetaceae bacterium]|nr:redoxin domain-containing protein [Planctomycetaceae bacterium]
MNCGSLKTKSGHITALCMVVMAMVVETRSGCADQRFAFTLPATDGTTVSVGMGGGSEKITVVCFLGAECPLARLYGPRLSEMSAEYSGKGVRFVGINSNVQDSPDDIRRYAGEHGINFPILRDDRNVVADRFGAIRTPEVFVLDSDLSVRYHGRVDDQYEPGLTRDKPHRQDLRIAINQLLSDTAVTVPETEPAGCFIGKVREQKSTTTETTVTFSKEICRILNRHCLECHRDGDIAPFSVATYDEVIGWADTMLETIDNGRMPPWHADPNVGHFANARAMSEADRQTFRDWVAAGMPQGDPAEQSKLPEFLKGWQLAREPDQIVEMRSVPFQVPAQGTVEYQYYIADPGFTEDKWVNGAQIIPGNRAVVHHAIAFIRPPDGSEFRGIGWLTAYVPGQRLSVVPPGYARRVPAGSKIVFQMHYTTNGTPQEDLTRIGLTFMDEADVTHELVTTIGIDQDFQIPPNAPDYPVEGSVRWFPKDGQLLAIAPHMHFRGKAFELTADRDGTIQKLLNVPHYDFNWQHAYELETPLPLADIRDLHFKVTFDNSDQNPFNPDPTEVVTWGDQTWEEMAVVFLEVAQPRERSGTKPDSLPKTNDIPLTDEQQRDVAAFVDDFLAEFDTNGDGVVRRSELPISVREFSFGVFDLDGNGIATRDEVRAAREERYRHTKHAAARRSTVTINRNKKVDVNE